MHRSRNAEFGYDQAPQTAVLLLELAQLADL